MTNIIMKENILAISRNSKNIPKEKIIGEKKTSEQDDENDTDGWDPPFLGEPFCWR